MEKTSYKKKNSTDSTNSTDLTGLQKIHLNQWIEKNKDLLVPPVNNRVLLDGKDFMVMIVGGPNQREDFHINEGEEFFYQIKGDLCLRVMTEKGPQDILVSEGEIYLLEALRPHSPQRPKNSLGIVIERERRPGEKDRFVWYCKKCHFKLYEEAIILKNIETELPKVFKKYIESKKSHQCKNCNFINKPAFPR